jgi:hypothetical protein
MDEPSWQQKEDLDNLETERLIDEQGERESEQMHWNQHWGGDDLGLEDGRPGLSWGFDSLGRSHLLLPEAWRLALAVATLALLVIICVYSFVVRHRVEEQHAQDLLRDPNGYSQQLPPSSAD